MYTILKGKKIWVNVVDDMNTDKPWAIGGFLWTDKKKAEAYVRDIRKYGFVTDKSEFKVVRLKFFNEPL